MAIGVQYWPVDDGGRSCCRERIMKGISHFITGVALATFFPEVAQAGAHGSLLPMLGGIGGILPDTLDFKFARYFEK